MLEAMRAVLADGAGGPEVLAVHDLPTPEPGPGEVLLEIAAAGLNRADLLQRQGNYPVPPGASDVLGMECSGTIAALGEGVSDWSVGDQVCALLAAGGYATHVTVPVGQLMPVPDGVSLVDAASLPEVAATVWSNVWMTARLAEGESFLVHGGAGGIGSFAIQLAHALGHRVLTTAGSPEKLELCRSLGADVAISYRDEDFAEVAKAEDGVDVILDNMGAKYLARNVSALAMDGRLVVIGMQGGAKAELDLGGLLRKRAAVIATALRGRPTDGPRGKAAICAQVVEHVWPLVASGQVRTLVHEKVPLDEVVRAHELMESGAHSGKILLTV
jgi:putative PIG3 family NAD(P)H quinone oxidoreductase